jgi:hypothetical protein
MPYPDMGETSTSEIIREGAEEIKDKAQEMAESISPSLRKSRGPAANVVIGILLIGLGIVFLARTLNITLASLAGCTHVDADYPYHRRYTAAQRTAYRQGEENKPWLSLVITDRRGGGEAA